MLHTTPQERLALGVVALLLAAGAAVRAAGGGAGVEWGGAAADTSEPGVSALRGGAEAAAAREARRRRPLEEGERLDVNQADADELDRLPRVGPALARRMVEHRAAHGPFRTLADLDAVPGVGPAMLAQLAPRVGLPPAPAAPAASRGAPPPPPGRAAPPAGPVDLNRAGAAELESLPGVGPALAARILEHRARGGGFRSVAELEQVPGIGPRLLARLAPLVRAGP